MYRKAINILYACFRRNACQVPSNRLNLRFRHETIFSAYRYGG